MVLKGGGGEQKRCLEGVCVCVGGGWGGLLLSGISLCCNHLKELTISNGKHILSSR